ncbi:hypothetical protein SAY86_014562 [Trapa natans]|uniref:K Homology domain-containing protein n=1 Tax=Trapa natans TaxID=22666 RepID=A0AAN7QN81_TRANT|nr:hypothetical protein SAY86_014562 [Trapa natans]
MEASSAPVGPSPPDPPPPLPSEPAHSTFTGIAASSATSKHTEASFRILCPASKTANVPLDVPGARIRILDECATSDERVVLVCSHSTHALTKEESSLDSGLQSEKLSAPQALVRVFESFIGFAEDSEKGSSLVGNQHEKADRVVVCRLLVGSNQLGSVGGKEGRFLEKIGQESQVSVRLVPRDQIPPCASPADEIIEIVGNISAVKQALLSISVSLHDNPVPNPAHYCSSAHSGGMYNSADTMPPLEDPFPHRGHSSGRYHSDYHKRSYSHGPGRMIGEEDVIFKILCQQAKVGSLIGKGGSIIRAIENDTGAYIKIADLIPETDERIVVISARENSDQQMSPALKAVMRVHHRVAEIGFEPGNPVVARLLIPSPQIRYLLGKGGSVINEMRRGTGASIRISPKDQSPRYGGYNDEVVQVMGSLQVVEDALFHITNRIHEFMLSLKHHHPSFGGPPFKPPFSDIPPPHVRPRHNPHSPGAYPPPPPVSIPHGVDGPIPPRPPLEHQPQFPRPPGGNYGGDRPGYGLPTFDRPPSPRMWGPPPFGGTPMGPRGGPHVSGNQGPVMPGATVEVVIPQALLGHVHGENDINLIDIRQISGAKVDIYGPKPGATEGLVVVGGTPDQVRAAQSLIHAFILSGQAF